MPSLDPWCSRTYCLGRKIFLRSLVAMETVHIQWASDTFHWKRMPGGDIHGLQFSASFTRLAKSRETWSILVCFILSLSRACPKGTSPNEAKQHAILKTLKQSLPLETGLGSLNAEFTPLHKQANWDSSKDGRQVQISHKEAITFSNVQRANI